MRDWNLLTNHGRVLLLIAADPDARLRDLAAALGVTERTAYGLVADLAEADYIAKEKDGRRNRYRVRTDLPVRDTAVRDCTVGDLLDLLVERRQEPRGTVADRAPG
jgi:DNA-binding IclR family transcriptional regulator